MATQTALVEQTLPLSKDFVDLEPNWARLLPLAHPSIRCSPDDPQVFLRESHQAARRSFSIAYQYRSPHLLVDGKIEAWSPDCEKTLDSWCKSLDPGKQWILIKQGEKSAVNEVRDIRVLQAETDVEAELFVETISACPAKALGEVLEHLHSTSRSVLAFLSPEKISKMEDMFPVNVMSSGTLEQENKFSSADELIESLLMLGMGNRSNQGHWVVHLANINNLSQLESYILLGAIKRSLSSTKGDVGRISWTCMSHPGHMRRGIGLAMAQIPGISNTESMSQHAQTNGKLNLDVGHKDITTNPELNLLDPKSLESIIRNGCEKLIAAEPEVTRFDVLTGDGDCGYTLADGARSVLDLLPSLDWSNPAASTDAIARSLETSMGGTSGALYCIFLSSVAYMLSLKSTTSFAKVLEGAFEELLRFTKARPGDRTCIDALQPFVESFAQGKGLSLAASAAAEGAERTKNMKPRMGRSTYLDDAVCHGIPDPGAYGLAILLKGFSSNV